MGGVEHGKNQHCKPTSMSAEPGRSTAGIVPDHAPETIFGLPKGITNTLFVLLDR